MPILTNQKLGNKSITTLEFGTGDIDVYPSIIPNNTIFFNQTYPKPLKDWGIGTEHTTEPTKTTDELDGKCVSMSFGRTESIDVVIECLQEVKRRMVEADKPKNFHDFSENPY